MSSVTLNGGLGKATARTGIVPDPYGAARRRCCSQEKRAGKVTEVHRESLTVPHPIQVVDAVIPLRLAIPEPGPAFLECYFADQLLGRRAVYFSTLPPGVGLKNPSAIEAATVEARAKMYECSDPYLLDHSVALAYWTLCEASKAEPMLLTFTNEAQAVYWKEYPLAFRTSLAAGFRAPPGSHAVRVDLVHATSRAVTPVTTARVESESSIALVQVHGELVVPIPRTGWYFVNLYCDDVLAGSMMLCAETSKVEFSYTLLPDDIARADAGDLLVVLKTAQSLAEMAQTGSQRGEEDVETPG